MGKVILEHTKFSNLKSNSLKLSLKADKRTFNTYIIDTNDYVNSSVLAK